MELTTIELFIIGMECRSVFESKQATECMKHAALNLGEKSKEEIMKRDMEEVVAALKDLSVGAPPEFIKTVEQHISIIQFFDMIKKTVR